MSWLDSRKITVKVRKTSIERDIESSTPIDAFQDILEEEIRQSGTIRKLAKERGILIKGENFSEHPFEEEPVRHMEEIMEYVTGLRNSLIFRGVPLESEKDYKKKMAVIEKTGSDKVPGKMPEGEKNTVREQGVEPDKAMWAAEKYNKAWEYTEGNPTPIRILLGYNPSALEKVPGKRRFLYRKKKDLRKNLDVFMHIRYL